MKKHASMSKLSASKVAAVVQQAPGVIRHLVGELTEARAKIASMEKAARVQRIAEEMQRKGLDEGVALDQKIAQLSRLNDHDLEVQEAAVKIAAAQGSSPVSTDERPGNATDPELAFIEGLARI